ncbi:MAG: ABC transporter substrate-binding protein, partial [Eggerthellaceae bacterium]|nr:ABC transporter substrate-binding protein [Eggerthellaceae bacterium]
MTEYEDFRKVLENDVSRRTFFKFGTASVGSVAAALMFGCSSSSNSASSSASAASASSAASSASSAAASASAASASASAASAGASKQTISFKDQNDYDVTVQVPCERMVVLQHHSLDMLCQLGAQSSIVGIVDSWKKNLGDYMTEVFPGIDKLPTPGGLSEWNVEQIAALNPDVVIAASQAPEDAMEQVRKLGIPVVVVSLRGDGKQAEAQNPRLATADAAYTEGCEGALKTLGKLAGKDAVAEKIWDFCFDSRAIVDNAIGSMADADRVKVAVLANGIAYGNDKYVG